MQWLLVICFLFTTAATDSADLPNVPQFGPSPTSYVYTGRYSRWGRDNLPDFSLAKAKSIEYWTPIVSDFVFVNNDGFSTGIPTSTAKHIQPLLKVNAQMNLIHEVEVSGRGEPSVARLIVVSEDDACVVKKPKYYKVDEKPWLNIRCGQTGGGRILNTISVPAEDKSYWIPLYERPAADATEGSHSFLTYIKVVKGLHGAFWVPMTATNAMVERVWLTIANDEGDLHRIQSSDNMSKLIWIERGVVDTRGDRHFVCGEVDLRTSLMRLELTNDGQSKEACIMYIAK